MARVDPPIFLMFAGPNGSGKSTITQAFRARDSFPANYVNADEIATTIAGNSSDIAYQAARIAESQRQELMAQRESLAFETVMSHPSKLALLEQATNLGYRVILVFVATNDPRINIERVSLRVRQGGHDVPRDKIIARYDRTLELLPAAVERTELVYIFDNSEHTPDAHAFRIERGLLSDPWYPIGHFLSFKDGMTHRPIFYIFCSVMVAI